MDDLAKEWDVLRENLPDDHAEAAEILFDRCDLMADRIEDFEDDFVRWRDSNQELRDRIKALEAEMEARIAEAVKAEREACAAVADKWARRTEVEAQKSVYRTSSKISMWSKIAEFDRIASAIRARGNK